MKQVVFITPPAVSHRTSEESLGMAYLTAILRRQNVPVTIIDNWLSGTTIDQTITVLKTITDCAFIGISAYISSINEVKDLIHKIKTEYSSSVKIATGGFGPTFHPMAFLDAGASFVIRGEAESTIISVYEYCCNNKSLESIPGLSYRDNLGLVIDTGLPTMETELDAIPFPARDTIGWTMERKNPVHITTSRGCMANCTFCSVIAFDRLPKTGIRYRQRSINNIVDEIELLSKEHGISNFKFVDDSFIEPPRGADWAKQFGGELKARNLGIRFRTQIRADRIDEALVAALTDAGWYATSIGVENWSPSALKRMNKTATLEQNLKAIQLLEKYGVYSQMGMILFDHSTTLTELIENYDVLKTLHWPVTKGIFTEMYASEGTPFMRILQKNRLEHEGVHGNSRYRMENESSRLVYQALKEWHKSHSEIYDHAINPISAPKSLPRQGYRRYWEHAIQLYDADVNFFGDILDAVQQGAASEEVMSLVERCVQETQVFYQEQLSILTGLDREFDLAYDADKNKFLEI